MEREGALITIEREAIIINYTQLRTMEDRIMTVLETYAYWCNDNLNIMGITDHFLMGWIYSASKR